MACSPNGSVTVSTEILFKVDIFGVSDDLQIYKETEN